MLAFCQCVHFPALNTCLPVFLIYFYSTCEVFSHGRYKLMTTTVFKIPRVCKMTYLSRLFGYLHEQLVINDFESSCSFWNLLFTRAPWYYSNFCDRNAFKRNETSYVLYRTKMLWQCGFLWDTIITTLLFYSLSFLFSFFSFPNFDF